MTRAKRRNNVLVVLGWLDHRLLAGISRYARDAGWLLSLRPLFRVTLTTAATCDAMLVSHSEDRQRERFSRRLASSRPTVIIGGNSPGFDAPMIREDDSMAGREAARYFLAQGHRHFAWLNLYPAASIARERRDGFRQTIEQAGLKCENLELRPPLGSRGVGSVRRWLSDRLRALPKPLALFALDDLLAADAIEICLDAGIRVPEEVAVMGVGNIEQACELSHVPISSVEFDYGQLGYAAARLLAEVMKGAPVQSPLRVPPVRIITRNSTDVVIAADRRLKAAVQYIAESLALSLGLDDIAARAGVSRRMLHHLFMRELHASPARYLLRMRLERAKRLLEQTDEKIESIARSCGFGSLRNLNRCFHRELAQSPRAYRQAQARALS